MAVVRGVAWVVLLMGGMLMAALAAEHLVKEAAKLGVDDSEERQNNDKAPHFD